MSNLLKRLYSIREKSMNMKKSLLPLAVLLLLSTNAVAEEYLGSYSGLNTGLVGDGPVQSVNMVVLSEGETGGSAGIAVSAEFTGQIFAYSSVNEAGPNNAQPGNSHLAMMFGGQDNNNSKTLASIAKLAPMSSIGGNPISVFYSPTPEDIGSGLDPATTYAFSQFVSVEGLLNENDIVPKPTNASYEMGQLTYTFSRPVDNPILHVTGLGAFFSSTETGLSMLFSVDLELVGTNSLTRLSGSQFTVLDSGSRIKNIYDYDDFANNIPVGGQGATGESAGSGSFVVNGNGVTSVTFNVHVVGKMTAPEPNPNQDIVPSYWSSLDGNNDLDGVPQTESVQKYVGDRFTTTWTLPLNKDFGDAIDDGSVIGAVARNYATDKSNNGPYHRILSGLQLGSIVDAETDVVSSTTGLRDDETGAADEDGVSLTQDGGSIIAVVTGTNSQDRNAMLCGWLDGGANGVVTGQFNRNITYEANGVGQSNPATVGSGNEELCIMVPKSDAAIQNTSVSLGGNSNPAEASCEVLAGESNFRCSLTWNPNFTDHAHTFARFRLTTAEEFFSAMSPSPTGYAVDGEVEDYAIDITPGNVQSDLTPVITMLPNVMVGTTNFEILIQVVELLNANTSDTITVRIPKDGRWSHAWSSNATSLPVSGKPLNNQDWTISEDANALIFTSTATILAGMQSNLGFPAVWNAGQTIGSFTASVSIVSGSGAEVRTDNNTDAEQAEYSFQ
ncbi:MAG: hypothetical protein ACI9XU_000444 [Arenicella sp.]|jgi:hypothetical protein